MCDTGVLDRNLRKFTFSSWNKYPCRFIKHNIIIKVKKKKNIYIYGSI